MADEFRVVLPAFGHDGRLPRKYTRDGQGALKNISPPLEWYNVPKVTKSLTLIVEDIDAPEPGGPLVPWTHWVVVNIPPTLKGLPEGFSSKEVELGAEFAGVQEGMNDWKVLGWGPPMPPTLGHRYRFKLYALDDSIHLGNKVAKDKLVDSMADHIIDEAETIALF